MNEPIIVAKDISKTYIDEHGAQVQILDKINLAIYPGDYVAIMGRSGSGKTTLLQLLGGLDDPSCGLLNLCKDLAFIYQLHHLLPEFNALENVAMPLLIKNWPAKLAYQAAYSQLDKVGLGHLAHLKPQQLSGGERQRVAVARALIIKPKCILADEPTGSLDDETAWQIINLILDLRSEYNTAVLMVTHDHDIAQRFNTIYHLQQGHLVRHEN